MKQLFFIFSFIILTTNAKSQRIYTETFYEILGLLDEYNGRFDWNTGKPHNDLIESFYPNENNLANNFEFLLHRYEKERNENYQITKQISNQGHIAFYSKRLAELLNSLYVCDSNSIATLNPKFVLNAERNCLIKYIKGCYLRYGTDFKFHISNAPKKIVTVGNALKQLGCKEIVIFEPIETSIPVELILTFLPTKEIRDELKTIPDKDEFGKFDRSKYKIYMKLN